MAQRSAVPAVEVRKRSGSRITDGIIGPSNKKQKKDWVGRKELQRLRDSLAETDHLSSRLIENDQCPEFDLWSGDNVAKDETVYDFLERPKPKVAPPTITHPPIAMTASGKPVKAIKPPAAGTSYNPSFTAWDDLLNQEGQKVVEAERERLREEQFEAERAARIAAIGPEANRGDRTDDESAWEGFESDYERSEWLNRKRPGRKTQAQRNKIKRRKEAERLALHEAKMVDRRKQIRELEQLAKNGGEDEASTRDQVVVVEDEAGSFDGGDDPVLRRKRLRNVAIPEKSLEVVLPDELPESLRRLKPEGNLLNDRFRHQLLNGKIEARKPVLQPKKKRVTYTEKWTYKDFRITV